MRAGAVIELAGDLLHHGHGARARRLVGEILALGRRHIPLLAVHRIDPDALTVIAHAHEH